MSAVAAASNNDIAIKVRLADSRGGAQVISTVPLKGAARVRFSALYDVQGRHLSKSIDRLGNIKGYNAGALFTADVYDLPPQLNNILDVLQGIADRGGALSESKYPSGGAVFQRTRGTATKSAMFPIDLDGYPIDVEFDSESIDEIIQSIKNALGAPFDVTACLWNITSSAKRGAKKANIRLYYLLDTELTTKERKNLAQKINASAQKKICDENIYAENRIIYVAPPTVDNCADYEFSERWGYVNDARQIISYEEIKPTLNNLNNLNNNNDDNNKKCTHASSRCFSEALSEFDDSKKGLHAAQLQACIIGHREKIPREQAIRAIIDATRDAVKNGRLIRDPERIKKENTFSVLRSMWSWCVNKERARKEEEKNLPERKKYYDENSQKLTLEDGRKKIFAKINSFFNDKNDKPLTVIKATTGVGKTTTLVDAVKWTIKNSVERVGNIIISCKTNAQADELEEMFRGAAYRIKGRGETNCKRSALLPLVAEAGLAEETHGTLCRRKVKDAQGRETEQICPYYQGCSYQEQFSGSNINKRVLITTHDILTNSNNRIYHTNWYKGVTHWVIDENPIDIMSPEVLQSRKLSDVERFDASLFVVLQAIKAKTSLVTTEATFFSEDENKFLCQVLNRSDKLKKARPHRIDVADDNLADELRRLKIQNAGAIDFDPLVQQIKDYLHDQSSSWVFRGGAVSWLQIPKLIPLQNLAIPSGARHVLLLDGTADETILARVFDGIGIDFCSVDVHDHTTVYQVSDIQAGKRSQSETRNVRVLGLLEKLRSEGQKVAFITHSGTLASVVSRPTFRHGEPILTGTFGSVRGLNAMQEATALVTYGRTEPAAEVVEDTAQLLFGEAPPKVSGYSFFRGGVVGHVNPYADLILEHVRATETMQCLGRLRGVIHQGKIAYVIANAPIPCRVVPTTLGELLPDAATAELLVRYGGVVPDSASLIHVQNADIFPKIRDAEWYVASRKNDRKVQDTLIYKGEAPKIGLSCTFRSFTPPLLAPRHEVYPPPLAPPPRLCEVAASGGADSNHVYAEDVYIYSQPSGGTMGQDRDTDRGKPCDIALRYFINGEPWWVVPTMTHQEALKYDRYACTIGISIDEINMYHNGILIEDDLKAILKQRQPDGRGASDNRL